LISCDEDADEPWTLVAPSGQVAAELHRPSGMQAIPRWQTLVAVSCLLCGCGDLDEPADDSGWRETTSTKAGSFYYGRHYPQGKAAVDYLYGPQGTWRQIAPAEYRWNYYKEHATARHPYDRDGLVAYADGTHTTVALDANGHLLLDFDHDGEIDVSNGGFAFHEHAGRGQNGEQRGRPFTNFWFDDNWLARLASRAYGRREPDGLSDYPDFTRWRVVGGDTRGWRPYNDSAPDRIALDGLYFAAKGNLHSAREALTQLIQRTRKSYDQERQRIDYRIDENYHLGLFLILATLLMDTDSSSSNDVIDHAMSVRSHLLSNQERAGSTPIGWRSGISKTDSLINTESISAAVLGLGAGARRVFEAGRSPLETGPGYFLRPHNVLSAVRGRSPQGHMTSGPGWTLPAGEHRADFYLRAPNAEGRMARLSVYDATGRRELASRVVEARDMPGGRSWMRVRLTFTTQAGHRLDLRTLWYGSADMDIACIRVY